MIGPPLNLYELYARPNELDGYDDRLRKVPHIAAEYLNEHPGNEDAEFGIHKDPFFSLEYAEGMLGERFPMGEPAIASDPRTVWYYSIQVIHGRFKEGERIIKFYGAMNREDHFGDAEMIQKIVCSKNYIEKFLS